MDQLLDSTCHFLFSMFIKTILSPLEKSAVIEQTHLGTTNFISLIKQNIKKGGIVFAGRGNLASCFKTSIHNSIEFPLLNFLSKALEHKRSSFPKLSCVDWTYLIKLGFPFNKKGLNLEQVRDINSFPFVIGAISGTVAAFFSYPIDVVRTLEFQNVDLAKVENKLNERSLRSIYSGFSYCIVGNFIYSGVKIGYFETTHGAVYATLFALIVAYPFEVLRKRAQVNSYLKRYNKERLFRGGYYKGFLATFIRIMPFNFAVLHFNNYIKSKHQH